MSTATVVVTIEGAADAPTNADAGGPYATTEGQGVSFAGTFSDPDIGDTHTFEWTVGGQVVSTDQNPTVDWSALVAVGGDDGPGSFPVVFTRHRRGWTQFFRHDHARHYQRSADRHDRRRAVEFLTDDRSRARHSS